MKMLRWALPFLLGVAMTPTGPSLAGPLPATPDAPAGLVVNVQADCHRDFRRHFLPEFGRRVTHRHRGQSCRIVLADDDNGGGGGGGGGGGDGGDDCHRDFRRHYLPEFGRRVTHRHRGDSCRIVLEDDGGGGGGGDGGGDCHRDVRRHYLPEYGRSVVHRHRGDSCRIIVLEERDSPGGSNCVRLGPVLFCEN